MTERFKELYAEAVMSVHEAFIDRMLVPSAIDLEFAELIVRECAKVADGGWADPRHQIKQHFGVDD
jgi:hypothetical protein